MLIIIRRAREVQLITQTRTRYEEESTDLPFRSLFDTTTPSFEVSRKIRCHAGIMSIVFRFLFSESRIAFTLSYLSLFGEKSIEY